MVDRLSSVISVWFFDNGALSRRHSRYIADLDYLGKTRETAEKESGDFCRS